MKQFIFQVFILFLFTACSRNKQLFELVDAQKSGITFNNKITINDTINILDNEFTYNGAGVAVGDLNGDGLLDAYFCGNQVENKFYLNRGNLNFEDVTIKAGVQKYKGQWSSGVTIVDINQDGLQDIYVCNTMIEDSIMLRDNLFINQGNNSEGIPTFKEMGADYGILDDTHNSISTFFDYDNDGDLDLLAVALREAREESGLSGIEPVTREIYDVDIHEIPPFKDVPSHYHFDVRFLLPNMVSSPLTT
jgi:hypothetical protein